MLSNVLFEQNIWDSFNSIDTLNNMENERNYSYTVKIPDNSNRKSVKANIKNGVLKVIFKKKINN